MSDRVKYSGWNPTGAPKQEPTAADIEAARALLASVDAKAKAEKAK